MSIQAPQLASRQVLGRYKTLGEPFEVRTATVKNFSKCKHIYGDHLSLRPVFYTNIGTFFGPILRAQWITHVVHFTVDFKIQTVHLADLERKLLHKLKFGEAEIHKGDMIEFFFEP